MHLQQGVRLIIRNKPLLTGSTILSKPSNPDEINELDSKKKAYKIYEEGILFNRLRVWNSIEDIEKSDYRGLVSIRYKGSSRGTGFYAYKIPVGELRSVTDEMRRNGAQINLLTFNENAPDEFLKIQGEIMRDIGGLYFFYSNEKQKMNDALLKGSHMRGLKCQMILHQLMDHVSFEELMDLLDIFKDHVIELGIYSKNLGCIPHRNTIIWEVRKY
jgi:hypothetical protein